jgi:hypothetical protein|tara:strand:+ start:6249 stop:6782 length:534 start_codon:yes stop_codon:yes gene_type:complete
MKRDYAEGTLETPTMFTGVEVEKTPAYGLQTLFVDGVQDIKTILQYYNEHNCKHIFFGANHSFNPGTKFPEDANQWTPWEDMILEFLKEGYLCSLDIPIALADAFLESGLTEYDNFIPQLRIPLPYVKQWNYNTMLKIDDKDFKATNPGVWCHSLHDLLDREKFTNWSKYGLDKVIK